MELEKFFSSLKVTNIYLKKVDYKDNDNLVREKKLTISKNKEILKKEDNKVIFLCKQQVLLNKGLKLKINIEFIIEIDIKIEDGYTEEEKEENLLKIADRIIATNDINKKIILLIANLTSSFGDNPLLIPDKSYEEVENE